jgi:hypothetical protein
MIMYSPRFTFRQSFVVSAFPPTTVNKGIEQRVSYEEIRIYVCYLGKRLGQGFALPIQAPKPWGVFLKGIAGRRSPLRWEFLVDGRECGYGTEHGSFGLATLHT